MKRSPNHSILFSPLCVLCVSLRLCGSPSVSARHITSGAWMPRRARALASVWRVASTRARRAVRVSPLRLHHRAGAVEVREALGEFVDVVRDDERLVRLRRAAHLRREVADLLQQVHLLGRRVGRGAARSSGIRARDALRLRRVRGCGRRGRGHTGYTARRGHRRRAPAPNRRRSRCCCPDRASRTAARRCRLSSATAAFVSSGRSGFFSSTAARARCDGIRRDILEEDRVAGARRHRPFRQGQPLIRQVAAFALPAGSPSVRAS